MVIEYLNTDTKRRDTGKIGKFQLNTNDFAKPAQNRKPATFWPEPDLGWLLKNGGFRPDPEPEPKSGTALLIIESPVSTRSQKDVT